MPGALQCKRNRSPATATLLGALAIALAASGQNPEQAEITTQETKSTFLLRAQRNLVVVRVVVRDANGHEIGSLRQQDFQLFDNGKLQTIAHFSIERPSSRHPPPAALAGQKLQPEAVPEHSGGPLMPQRFLALFFDDVHLKFEDLASVRDAADHYLTARLTPEDRAGIFTSSGQGILDFTNDREKLHKALSRLQSRRILGTRESHPCPDLSDYEAYLLVDRHDSDALLVATIETVDCLCGGIATGCPAEQHAVTVARQIVEESENQARYTFRGLDQLVRRMEPIPGERTIVLVSPGFLNLNLLYETSDTINRALRSSIIISALDAKGLDVVLPFGDAAQNAPVPPAVAGKVASMRLAGHSLDSDVMAEVASSTGGTFFHNSNDLDRGFREAGRLPEVSYVLAFSPQDLKYDGKFHNLKVNLLTQTHVTVQARRGYFAPRKALDPKEQAEEEIRQALFSQQELNEIPVTVHTQFFKPDNLVARLSVVTRLDAHFIQFHKDQGRNLDDVSVAVALFDQTGNFVDGQQQQIQFRLRDETLQKLSKSGIATKTSFDVKPGTYLLRTVVRDAADAKISAVNNTVEIPY